MYDAALYGAIQAGSRLLGAGDPPPGRSHGRDIRNITAIPSQTFADSEEILVRSLSTGVGERRVGPSRHLENTLVRRTLLHNRLIYRDALREIVRISRFVLCTG